MTPSEIIEFLADRWWPSFAAVLFGCLLAQLFFDRRPDAQRVRQDIGRALDRFQDVPGEALDSALLAAARPGWITVLSTLLFAVSFQTAILSMELYRLMLPTQPGWPSILVGTVIFSALSGLQKIIEGRWILYRVERLVGSARYKTRQATR